MHSHRSLGDGSLGTGRATGVTAEQEESRVSLKDECEQVHGGHDWVKVSRGILQCKRCLWPVATAKTEDERERDMERWMQAFPR
jgi:hypothetical protein